MTEGLDTILEQAASGDQAAWRVIVEDYGPRVFRLLRSRCGDDELAEEIAQSVFCTVAAKIGAEGYREQGKFEAWLFRIAMNRLRDEMRRRGRQATPTAPEDLAGLARSHEDSFGSGEDRRRSIAALREAIARLPEADRQALELRHLAGMSFRQIAEFLDEPLGTVLARQHRALRKLKSMLSESHAGP